MAMGMDVHNMQHTISPGLSDISPEQIRNKLKISAYVLETT